MTIDKVKPATFHRPSPATQWKKYHRPGNGELLTLGELARELGETERTIRNWRKQGSCPRMVIGHKPYDSRSPPSWPHWKNDRSKPDETPNDEYHLNEKYPAPRAIEIRDGRILKRTAMQDYQTNPAGQLKSGNAFTVINNVRDQCQQPADKKFLLLTLATYCDGKGICWPSNRALMRATGKSERTIQRTLKALEQDGEFKVVTQGGGHQKRVIQFLSLRRHNRKGCRSYDGGGGVTLPRRNVSEQPYRTTGPRKRKTL